MVGALVRDSKEVDSVSAIPRVVAEACNPQVQDLIILPTEKCNFRCTYCYEDFAVGKMSEAVQRAVEQFMSNRIPDLAQLSIKWFGGEPLVAKAVVLRLSAHAKSLCDQHGVGLSGGLTTNAWLLDYATFSELVSYDQRFFQITLDGWKDVHDTFRRRANGRGTFDRIWENLLATRESDDQFEIQLRVHIRRGDQGSIEELLQHIAAEFGNDPRYSIDFEHIRNLGGEGGKTVANPLSLDELKAIERDLRAFYERQIASYHPSMARCAGGIPDPSVDTVCPPSAPMAQI
ncbi:hypothetical protein GCM10022600_07630 [Qipengyuania pelagi]|uniref:Radical SAM protein n=1 Tax=Qipengyuania pelagi TaxID=994320 RepID=A0A844Y6W8_9SPHN|nr:radical SAM protein [Qipengyuania pelagi]MXO54360.1 radical SAM protein [Qipengyuania pelagi]